MALQHTDFDLFAEGLCHGLDDADPSHFLTPSMLRLGDLVVR